MNLTSKKRLLMVVLVIVVAVYPITSYAQARKRADIPEKYKWNLEDIYSNTEQLMADFNKMKDEYIPKIQGYKDELNTPANILSCFKIWEDSMKVMDRVYVYCSLKLDENQADNDVTELQGEAYGLYSKLIQAVSYIQPELLKQPEEQLLKLVEDPTLEEYSQLILSIIDQKERTLSAESEEILARASTLTGSANEIFSKITNADMIYPKIPDMEGNLYQLSGANYGSFLESNDRSLRKNAFEGIYMEYDKIKNTLAANLNTEINKNIFYAKSRKYDSALEAALDSEAIPRSVYDNLVKSVNKNIKSLHKYIELRKKVMGIDKVHAYDMYVPLIDTYKMDVDYEKGKDLLLKGLQPLGDDYIKSLGMALESRWIDVYETENKYTGAYQWGAYTTHPYVLINYDDSVDSLMTLAHEMGHAMNSYYTNKTQKYLNSTVPIFNAEVASTANELFMNDYLLANAKNDDEKLYILNSLIESIRGTVFTQVMYAEFEKTVTEKVENGEALSANSFSAVWGELMKKYFGNEFANDTFANLWWSRIPHFYMNFYVYKYATSMAAANEIVQNIKANVGVNDYLNYLKSGSSDYPIELLKKTGVDMTTTKAVDGLLAKFGDLVSQMENILQKKGKLNENRNLEAPLTVNLLTNPVISKIVPKKEDGIIIAPVRKLAESLDATVKWVAPKYIMINKDRINIKLEIGSDNAIVNGKNVSLDSKVKFIGSGTTYIEMRFLTEALGYKMEFDEVSNTVKVID